MNTEQALLMCLCAEQACEETAGLYCGLDNRNSRLVVAVAADESLPALQDEFHFVTDSREAMIKWLTEVGFRETARVLLADFDKAEAAMDLTAASRAADRLIEAIREWAEVPGPVVLTDLPLEAIELAPPGEDKQI